MQVLDLVPSNSLAAHGYSPSISIIHRRLLSRLTGSIFFCFRSHFDSVIPSFLAHSGQITVCINSPLSTHRPTNIIVNR
jgi:hypothetical protein